MAVGESRRNKPASAPRGRPRDAAIDDLLLTTAIAVFAERGWAGFSIERVAREAGVGKGTVYLRWSSTTELLRDALRAKLTFVDDPDTGDLRKDLLALARQLSDIYAGDLGRAFLRLYIEADLIPGLGAYWDFQQDQMKAARAILRRGMARGEIGDAIRVTTMLDALSGGILIHSLTAPALVVQSRVARERVIGELVDMVLTSSPPAQSDNA